MDHPRYRRSLCQLFSVKHYKFYLQEINMKNVYPVYGAWNRTHNLRNMSVLPLPLDQGSGPIARHFWIAQFERRPFNVSKQFGIRDWTKLEKGKKC